MPLKSIILMRHGEREDRAAENKGIDWISNASRPQDPSLSQLGKLQAKLAAQAMLLQQLNIKKIFASPTVRCVETAHEVATIQGPSSVICIEEGLVEEAKSMRGRKEGEKIPNFDPLVLTPLQLAVVYSDRVDIHSTSLCSVSHIQDARMGYNQVREISLDGSDINIHDLNAITIARTNACALKLVKFCLGEFSSSPENVTVVCVGHGASINGMAVSLQKGCPESKKIRGQRNVSCFAEFVLTKSESDDGNITFFTPTTLCWQEAHLESLVSSSVEGAGKSYGERKIDAGVKS